MDRCASSAVLGEDQDWTWHTGLLQGSPHSFQVSVVSTALQAPGTLLSRRFLLQQQQPLQTGLKLGFMVPAGNRPRRDAGLGCLARWGLWSYFEMKEATGSEWKMMPAVNKNAQEKVENAAGDDLWWLGSWGTAVFFVYTLKRFYELL